MRLTSLCYWHFSLFTWRSHESVYVLSVLRHVGLWHLLIMWQFYNTLWGGGHYPHISGCRNLLSPHILTSHFRMNILDSFFSGLQDSTMNKEGTFSFKTSAPFQHYEQSVMTREATAGNVALPINREQPNETHSKISEILFHLQQNRIVGQRAADFYYNLWGVRKRLDCSERCFVSLDRQSFQNNTNKESVPTRQWHLHVLSFLHHQHFPPPAEILLTFSLHSNFSLQYP